MNSNALPIGLLSRILSDDSNKNIVLVCVLLVGSREINIYPTFSSKGMSSYKLVQHIPEEDFARKCEPMAIGKDSGI